MPRNGSGTYAPPAGQPVVSGTIVLASTFNALVADVSSELTRSISTDGQTPMAASLPMGNNKITGLAPGVSPTDAVRVDQLTGGPFSFIQSGAGAVSRPLQDKVRESVSVKDYGALGDGVTDDTAAFNKASVAARRVYIPPGTYILDSANFPANTEFYGDGDVSILKMTASASYVLTCDSGSSNTANNISNLILRNVQLRATCDTDGFSQFKNLVSLNGVTNVLIENVLFKGFRGDGLYIGSGNVGGQERHNQNVIVRHCRFDGINRANRNGTSFIDIDGVLVEDNVYTNCTSSAQPGPIDFEPDANAWGIIRNIVVRRNTFSNNGGNVGEVCIQVPAAVTTAPSNITIENNVSDGYGTNGTGQFVLFSDNRLTSVTAADSNLKIRYNTVKNGCKPLGLFTGKRILVEGNLFQDMTQTLFLGYTDAVAHVRDVDFIQNRFIRCGSVFGSAISVFNADYVNFFRNKFYDCGTGVAGSANALDFNTGASSYINFDGNEFLSPTGKTLIAVQVEAGHTTTASTNSFMRNILNSLQMNFPCDESDTVDRPFTPVVTGSTTAGTGTYNSSTTWGRYRRIGRTMFFWMKVAVNAGHTGTGMIQVTLPTLAAANTNNQEYLVNVSLDGVTSTGGQIGMINPALVVSSVGAVRCYCSGTGTGAGSTGQITIPAGAFTINISGFYPIP